MKWEAKQKESACGGELCWSCCCKGILAEMTLENISKTNYNINNSNNSLTTTTATYYNSILSAMYQWNESYDTCYTVEEHKKKNTY